MDKVEETEESGEEQEWEEEMLEQQIDWQSPAFERREEAWERLRNEQKEDGGKSPWRHADTGEEAKTASHLQEQEEEFVAQGLNGAVHGPARKWPSFPSS